MNGRLDLSRRKGSRKGGLNGRAAADSRELPLLGRVQPALGLAVKIFCKRYGSSLFGTREPESETIWVRMGVRPGQHVWVSSAPAWFPVPEDGLLRFESWSPGR